MKTLQTTLLLLLMAVCSIKSSATPIDVNDQVLVTNQRQLIRLAFVEDSLEQLDQVNALQLDIKLNSTDDPNVKATILAERDSIPFKKAARQLELKQKIATIRNASQGAPVTLGKDTLFLIYSKLGPYPASDRANNISNKLDWIIEQNLFNQDQIMISEGDNSQDILYNDVILTSITANDALWEGLTTKELAEARVKQIEVAVMASLENSGVMATLWRLAALLLLITIVYFGVKYMNKGFTWLNRQLITKWKPYIKGIKLKNYELFTDEQMERTLILVLKVLKWIVISFVVYLSLPTMFSIFPSTKGIATALFGYVLNPLKHYGITIISYIPKFITIVVVVVATRYLVRFIKFIASEIEKGKLRIPGFYEDWAKPSFNLLRVIIWAFSFVIIFPYLPGSGSTVFQGVSVFFGLLISLGSSSAISNIIAGLVITYMRAFKNGDRVKIGETTGDVIEKTMLVTRVRTIKNEDVTIPNASILNGSTINYTTSAKTLGLVLHTTVTIGYDVDWRIVHDLLIGAAKKVDRIQQEPSPFVLQKSLDDFYVSYELNAHTEQAEAASKIYSEIHANIQDAFSAAGIEILSPHYRAQRDGSAFTVPADKVPQDFKPAPFNININKDV